MGDSLLALRPFLVCYKKATGLSMQILVPCLNHTVPQYCQCCARHNDHYINKSHSLFLWNSCVLTSIVVVHSDYSAAFH